MNIRLGHTVAAALASIAAPAAAQSFTDISAIDSEVAAFLGVPPAAAGSAFIPVDRRLKLAPCSQTLSLGWPGTRRDSVLVQCPQAGGWKLYVRVIGQQTAGPAQAAAAPVVKRGDAVTVMVRAASFSVSQEGQALESGAVGEWVRVKVGKDKEMQAQVLRPGSVGISMP